jgi:hypothetical protein
MVNEEKWTREAKSFGTELITCAVHGEREKLSKFWKLSIADPVKAKTTVAYCLWFVGVRLADGEH